MRSHARAAGSAVALVLGAVLLALSLVGWWVRTTVSDTDTYVATVAPLADDPDVQAAVVRRLTTLVMTQLDERAPLVAAADALEERGVPPAVARLVELLAEPLRDRVEQTVRRLAERVVGSPGFADAWRTSNQTAHAELVDVLEDDGDLTVGDDTAVTIRLATLTNAVRSELVDAGVPGAERLQPVDASFPVASSAQLAQVREGYRLLRRATALLVVLTIVLVVGGVLLSRRRLRSVVRLCLGAAGVLLLLLVGVAVARGQLVDALPEGASPAAATAAFDVLTDRLRTLVRGGVVLLLLVAVAVWAARDHDARARARRGVARALRAGRAAPGAGVAGWVVCGLAVAAVLLGAVAGPWSLLGLLALAGAGAALGTSARAAP